eukprot:SAG31_NODE_1555_length_7895_cov_46.107748_2_plen_120_part_00
MAVIEEMRAQRARLGAHIDEYIDIHMRKLEERRRMLQADADMMTRQKAVRLKRQAVQLEAMEESIKNCLSFAESTLASGQHYPYSYFCIFVLACDIRVGAGRGPHRCYSSTAVAWSPTC